MRFAGVTGVKSAFTPRSLASSSEISISKPVNLPEASVKPHGTCATCEPTLSTPELLMESIVWARARPGASTAATDIAAARNARRDSKLSVMVVPLL